MASITKSSTRRGGPVTMRLTPVELGLLLRGVKLLAEFLPAVSPQHKRLISEMELFFHNEESGSPAEVTK